jgi:ABC-type glycerol-3-phosphate transport system permease component
MDLREAAIIEGAGEFYTYFKIIVPLSTAIFATIGLFTVVAKWNSWYDALIYLKSQEKYPYQLILRRILDEAMNTISKTDDMMQEMYTESKYNERNLQMAAVVIGIVPILCVYPFAQKYFVKGVFVGSLKG